MSLLKGFLHFAVSPSQGSRVDLAAAVCGIYGSLLQRCFVFVHNLLVAFLAMYFDHSLFKDQVILVAEMIRRINNIGKGL